MSDSGAVHSPKTFKIMNVDMVERLREINSNIVHVDVLPISLRRRLEQIVRKSNS